MYSNEKYLLELLQESGLLTDRDIQGVASTKKPGESVLETLIKTGVVSDEQVAQTVAVNSGMEYVDLHGFEPHPSLKSLVPLEVAARYKVAPLGTNGSALQVVVDYKGTKRELTGKANRIGADVRYAISGKRLATGFGFHKVSADDVKTPLLGGTTVAYGLSHSEVRAWMMHEKGKMSLSLDGIVYTFDDKRNPNLNGKSSMFEVVGSLGYQATANVKVSGDLSFGANPEVKKDPFSQWEDAVIIKAHREHGNKWASECLLRCRG